MQEINIQHIISDLKFDSFLKGSEGYSLINKQADMPTDNILVVDNLKKYYILTNDESVWKEFEKSLINLSKDKEYIFLVPLYIHSYLYISKELDIQPVDIERVKDVFSKSLIAFGPYLKENKNWIGNNMEGGLLAYINYMQGLIKRDFNIIL